MSGGVILGPAFVVFAEVLRRLSLPSLTRTMDVAVILVGVLTALTAALKIQHVTESVSLLVHKARCQRYFFSRK